MIARVLACVMCFWAVCASAQCRQALVLGLDVSGSVDAREYALQIGGLAAALRRPDVTQLILSNVATPVRLAIFEWSEPGHERLLLDWTEVRSMADLDVIALQLTSVSRSSAPRGTAVGSAMLYGADLLSQQQECWIRTLDLSGDGKHNVGPHPKQIKARLDGTGIIINGLVIGADDPSHSDKRYVQISEISAYYNTWVILGPNAFVEVALGFEAYEDAMTRKLVRELQGLTLSQIIPDQ
ncbi:MAG: DUF1194 domain-containing protein [Pseudomonadota bacterium]